MGKYWQSERGYVTALCVVAQWIPARNTDSDVVVVDDVDVIDVEGRCISDMVVV
jgi:hypothetical protein